MSYCVNVTDVLSAINIKLANLGYPVKDVDITKEIPRPCVVAEIERIANSKAASDYTEETMQLVISYFAQRREKGYAELLKFKADLQALLEAPIEVKSGFWITANEVDYHINRSDMALVTDLELITVQWPQEDEKFEMMEELEWMGEN